MLYFNFSDLVWNFQSRFGVEKLKIVEENRGKPFRPIEVSSEAEIRVRRSNSEASLTDKKSSEDDDTAGASDASAKNENRIYYRIGNRFWHYLFLLGSQLGDETYYSIFFSFWFWNIDGAVGRRVILVWNLIMYIGSSSLLHFLGGGEHSPLQGLIFTSCQIQTPLGRFGSAYASSLCLVPLQ